ncbi:MAG: hypothetical protein IJV22_09640 [Bacteroidales bacterium]|nr:hypothetical protein [Bacteroidales bacterium]
MRKHLLLLLFTISSSLISLFAQPCYNDGHTLNLRGYVHSMRETTRGLHGHINGTPCEYVFNGVGNFDHIVVFDTFYNPTVRVDYKYDSMGLLSRDVRIQLSTEQLILETSYMRDLRRHAITADVFGVMDSTSFMEESFYDDDCNMVQHLVYDADKNVVYRTDHRYDRYGNCIEIDHFESAEDSYRFTERMRYDTEGNLIDQCTYHLESLHQHLVFTYEFDEYRNWTRQYVYHITSSGAELFKVVERTLTYYTD